jgi:hypothetical protein
MPREILFGVKGRVSIVTSDSSSPVEVTAAVAMHVWLVTRLQAINCDSRSRRRGGHCNILDFFLDDDHTDEIAYGNVVGPNNLVAVIFHWWLRSGCNGRFGECSNATGAAAVDDAAAVLLEDLPRLVVGVGRLDTRGVANGGDCHGGRRGQLRLMRRLLTGDGGFRAELDGYATRKDGSNNTSNFLVSKLGRDLRKALLLCVLALESENWAVFDIARRVPAGVDSLLEEVHIPAGHEVGVVAKAYQNVSKGPDRRHQLRTVYIP